MKHVVGLDCETFDPLLKTSGWSWKYGQGYILNTALYYEDTDEIKVIAGIRNENCPFDLIDRQCANKEIIDLLTDSNVCIVGANILYDLGWLLYEYNMTVYDVKCSFVDVLQAESILDEFSIHTLESVSQKYLKYGKSKDRIEDWVKDNISAKGDFRQHLKEAPWDLLCEYVQGDAKNPVKVWRKQLTLLKEQDLCSRCKLEFDCILPTLAMTMNGMPFDVEQKEKNLEYLTHAINKLKAEFMEKYNLPKFRVTASNDIASFCDMRKIPYRCKITLKGYNHEPFGNDYIKIDSAYAKAKRIVSSFRYVKSIPVAYVPKEMADRTCDLLSEEGFMYTCSPNVDKKFFASARETYPEIGLIADWKLAEGIKSKILGDKYDRFLTTNSKGESCIKPQFKITDTISFRYSANMPNCIAEDTLLLTPQGYKPLYCLKEGDSIYNGNGDLTVIKHIWYKGKRNCLSLVSANGAELICTPEHKQWNGKDWIKAEELNETDIIEKRADCLSLSKNVDNTSDNRSAKSLPRNYRKGVEGGTSYRPQPLKQQLGQLGSMYTISSYKVTSTTCGVRRVYDIEVESEDHSFIANGFRTKNCQQIPSKGGFVIHNADGSEEEVSFPKLTRTLFKASKGCVFGKIDYGQIEYRLICNIACGEAGEEVRRQYAENPHMDFHQYVVDLTGLSRKYAKNMSFGVSFGMGLASMAENFGWTMERAEEISEQYHKHMPFVAPTLALVGDVAKKRGYIRTVCGSHARLPNPNKSYTMLNRYTQGSGGECLKSSIVQAYKEGLWERLKPSNTVHDELNFPYLTPTRECMIDFYRMAEVMRTSVKGLKVPLEAEIELGENWASTKTIPEWLEIRKEEPEKWAKLSSELRASVEICEQLLTEGAVD